MTDKPCETCQAMRKKILIALRSGNLTGAAKQSAIGALMLMGYEWGKDDEVGQ